MGTIRNDDTILVDINGNKGPNTYGRDIFQFKINRKNGSIYASNDTHGGSRSCTGSGASLLCLYKIIEDGWKMNY